MKVLIIDDDTVRINPLKSYLTLCGFDTELCTGVDDAMEYIEQNIDSIDIILLDIMIPNGELLSGSDTRNGKETGLHFFKKMREIYHGPVVFYTVIRRRELVMSFIGDDKRADYLTKPQEPAKIVEKIYEMIAA